MRLQFLSLIVAAGLISSALARAPRDYAIEISAEFDNSRNQVVLSWPANAATTSYQSIPKVAGFAFLGLRSSRRRDHPTGCVDKTVVPGTEYEYSVRAEVTDGTSYQRIGYVRTGAAAPLRENRGKIVLVVDSTKAAPLAVELARFAQDLIGDGWSVVRRDVDPGSNVESVRAVIKASTPPILRTSNRCCFLGGSRSPTRVTSSRTRISTTKVPGRQMWFMRI